MATVPNGFGKSMKISPEDNEDCANFKTCAPLSYKAVLFKAAKEGDVYQIEKYLNSPKSDVNITFGLKSETLLHVAAGYNKLDVVNLLLRRKIDTEIRSNDGSVALHHSCFHHHVTLSCALINACSDVNSLNNRLLTPLRVSMMNPKKGFHYKLAKRLISHGANPYLRSCSGTKIIDAISDKVDPLTLQSIADMYEDYVKSKIVPYDTQTLINYLFDIVKSDDNLKIFKTLITPQVINTQLPIEKITLLHRAAGYNCIMIVQFLLSQGADVDAKNCEMMIPLHNAAHHGHQKIVEMLASGGSDLHHPDIYGNTPLHEAARRSHTHVCSLLVRLGASLDRRNNLGMTPFEVATAADVRVLLWEVSQKIPALPQNNTGTIYLSIAESDPFKSDKIVKPDVENEVYAHLTSFDTFFSARNIEPSRENELALRPISPTSYIYNMIVSRMNETIRSHDEASGGIFSRYEITKIIEVSNERLRRDYLEECERLRKNNDGNVNEMMLFHASPDIDPIVWSGFDKFFAKIESMFGAGIYFARHSSKSNQYVFKPGSPGCEKHQTRSCYECERNMLLCRVALGNTHYATRSVPYHSSPPGHHSVSALPSRVEDLKYPEYVIYQGNRAYPWFIIQYKIEP